MAELRLFVLGPPRVELDGKPVDLQRRRTLALLVYLAVSGQPHSRDALATLFYPDLDQQRARAYLRRDLAVLTTQMGRRWLEADRETVELRRDPDLWLDIAHFRRLAAAGQSKDDSPESICDECLSLLAEAAALYTDNFLAGFTLADSAEFDDWQFFQGESLRQELAALLQSLIAGLSAQGNDAAAIPHARRWVALDPLHEPAQRRLIELYGLTGQMAAARRQYEEFVSLLEEELGLAPEAETTALYEAVKTQRRLAPSAPAAPPNQRTERRADGRQTRPVHNLPLHTTPFIGRENELAALRRLLLEDAAFRLLTLVGPGGIGKTRLTLEAARRCLEPAGVNGAAGAQPLGGTAFDAVAFVDLAAVSASHVAGEGVDWRVLAAGQAENMILGAVAAALEFTFHGAAAVKTQLLAYLRPQKVLLVLDNFEHLVEGAGLLVELLRAAPAARLLVTSRERLNLPEEQVWEVVGLAYPQEDGPIASLAYYDAVAFFCLQAQRVRGDFNLDAGTAPHVLRLCRLVEGAPLALELAAGWLRALSCVEVVAEIERNIDFLTATTRNIPARHRSLRAIFEQSWQMLSAPERSALSRLSLFQGGFQREAAEVVAGAGLGILVNLVDKSLLRLAPSGRYHVHELLRQFASEKLGAEKLHGPDNGPDKRAADEAGGEPEDEAAVTRRRYITYYLRMVARRAVGLRGSTPQETLDELRADLGNIRQAWQWAVAAAQVAEIDAALDGLARFYDLTSLFAEGVAVFGQAAADLQMQAPPRDAAAEQAIRRLVVKLWVEQARLLNRRGLSEQGLQIMPQAAALAQQVGDTALEALAYYQWGDALIFFGQSVAAQARLEKSVELARAAGQPTIEAEALRHLGNCRAYQGDTAGALNAYESALARFRGLHERRGEGEVLNNLASFQQRSGMWSEAVAGYELALHIFEEIGYRWGQESVLNNMGTLHHDLGQYSQARAYCLQSLQIATEIKNHWGAGHVLDTLGTIKRELGDFAAAQNYYRQALEIWRTYVSPVYESDTLAEQALLWHLLGDDEAARTCSRQAEQIGREAGSPRIRASALTHLGHAQAALGLAADATDSYCQALALCREMGQLYYAREILAGLSLAALAAGDPAQAQAYAGELLPQLGAEQLYGARQPLQVYWSCYQVLQAGQDPRAVEVLAAANQLLQKRAAAISDERLRRCFLENIPAHRAITAASA